MATELTSLLNLHSLEFIISIRSDLQEGVMAAKSYPRGRITRDAILSGAAGVFSAHGYSTTSLMDVLSDLGLTKGAFYHHWECKEDLAVDLLRHMVAENQAMIMPRLEHAETAWERIEVFLGVVSAGAEPHAVVCPCRTLLGSLSFSLPDDAKRLSDEIDRVYKEQIGCWTDLLQQGQSEGSVRSDIPASLMAELIMGLLCGGKTSSAAGAESHSHRDRMMALLKMVGTPTGHLQSDLDAN
jgi:TetR/AcrR family transcriptional repressor of nem operon